MKLSIVSTMYCSASYVEEFCRRIKASVQRITDDYEVILVNDGSPDRSLEAALEMQAEDNRIKVVDLSRNFGHHAAIVAGLSQAQGARIFLIDMDLEEDPAWLIEFWQALEQSGGDVVYGRQVKRNGGWFKSFSGNAFYYLFNKMSDIRIPDNPCTVRLMSRDYVNALLQLKDKNLFLAGNCEWTGFNQQALDVMKKSNKTSTYNISRMVNVFINAITSFSSYPLQMAFWLGMTIVLFSGVLGLYIIARKLLFPEEVLLGYASLVISIWFLAGVIIFFIGVIGIYLAKIFNEVKERPQFIIKKIWVGNK